MAFTLSDDPRFQYGDVLSGTFSGGQEHGIEFTRGANGRPVTRSMCMNLEHYYSPSAKGGLFAPRNKAPLAISRIDAAAVRIDIAEYGDWHVRCTITYRLLPECLIEAEYRFEFGAGYSHFEGFVSNYFHEPTLPWLRLGGRWQQARLDDPAHEHRFWCRSQEDADALRAVLPARDAEYRELGQTDLAMPVDSAAYDEPVMVSPIRDTGWAVVHWVERDACPSLSANVRWRAHDFSLIGRDVTKGEKITCRAWMAYRNLANRDDALVFPENTARR